MTDTAMRESLASPLTRRSGGQEALKSGSLPYEFTIDFLGWENLHNLMKFALKSEVEIMDSNKAELVLNNYEFEENKVTDLLSHLRDEERNLLQRFSDKVNSKKKSKTASEYCFILLEILIFVGPTLVGQAKKYPTFLITDRASFKKPLVFRLSHNKKKSDEDETMIEIYSENSEKFVSRSQYYA